MREAIILAGGRGTRLQSVVADVPKPMAPVAGKPFLCYLFEQLAAANFSRIVLSVGYKHEVIQGYFGNSYKGMEISYAIESEPLGTGGGLRLAMKLCKQEHVFVLNGDTFFDLDFDQFQRVHSENKGGVTLGLKHIKNTTRYGMVALKENKIAAFTEKSEEPKSGYINGGIYLVPGQAFLNTTELGVFSFETAFLQKQSLPLYGFISEGYFIDIGIPEDYETANHYFTSSTD